MFCICIFVQVISDINLSQSLWQYALDKDNEKLKGGNQRQTMFILALLSTVFVVIPYLLNFVFLLQLRVHLKKRAPFNKHSKKFFADNNRIMALLILCSGGVYPVLQFFNSRALMLNMLYLGLTRTELKKFAPVRMYLSTMFEVWYYFFFVSFGEWFLIGCALFFCVIQNTPQIIVQILVMAFFSDAASSAAVWFALMSSSVSAFSVVVAFIWQKSESDLWHETPFEIKIRIELNASRHLDQKMKTKLRREIKWSNHMHADVRDAIVNVFDLSKRHVEIGNISYSDTKESGTLTIYGCVIRDDKEVGAIDLGHNLPTDDDDFLQLLFDMFVTLRDIPDARTFISEVSGKVTLFDLSDEDMKAGTVRASTIDRASTKARLQMVTSNSMLDVGGNMEVAIEMGTVGGGGGGGGRTTSAGAREGAGKTSTATTMAAPAPAAEGALPATGDGDGDDDGAGASPRFGGRMPDVDDMLGLELGGGDGGGSVMAAAAVARPEGDGQVTGEAPHRFSETGL